MVKLFDLANIEVVGPLSDEEDAELIIVEFGHSALDFVGWSMFANVLCLYKEGVTEALTF